MGFAFSRILIAIGAVLGLFGVTVAFVLWQRQLSELVAELPLEPGRRALRSIRSAMIPCLLATYPALLAWKIANYVLPHGLQSTWWGALLVTYAACWLLLYAVLEHKWRIYQQS